MVPHEYADRGIAEASNESTRPTRSEPNSQGIHQSSYYADRKRPPRPCRTPEDRDRERSSAAEFTSRGYLDVRLFCDKLCPGVHEYSRKHRICDLEAPCIGRNHGTQPSVAALGLQALGA
jgi:hypothetical protein